MCPKQDDNKSFSKFMGDLDKHLTFDVIVSLIIIVAAIIFSLLGIAITGLMELHYTLESALVDTIKIMILILFLKFVVRLFKD
jgi:hypothetical protein